jgi:hypothetical protein
MNVERKGNIGLVAKNDIKPKFKSKIMGNTFETLIPRSSTEGEINLIFDRRNERRGNL